MNYLLRFLASKGAEFGTFEEVRTKKPNPLTAATPIIDETQELRRKLEAREALLEKLLSSDPKVAEAAAQEWAEGKRKQS